MTANAPWVLGVAASHNGGACLLRGDEIVAAVQEERLTRYKRARLTGSQRSLAASYCLQAGGITLDQLDAVGFTSALAFDDPSNDLTAHPDWPKLARIPLVRVSHHRAHALAAYATSGFPTCAVLVIDGAGSPNRDLDAAEQSISAGVGAVETVSIYQAEGAQLRPVAKHLGFWVAARPVGMAGFGSLGGMFSAVSQQIFGDLSEAGKVMGLAPYGHPSIAAEQFVHRDGASLVFPTAVPDAYRHDRRWPELTQDYQDLAASVQRALDGTVMSLVAEATRQTGCAQLAYAGGVALNCTTNELIARAVGAANLRVMAAAEDNGTAIGAAYQALWTLTGSGSRRPIRRDSLGRSYSDDAIASTLEARPGLTYRRSSDAVVEAAQRLADGQFVGWFDGGSEFGPRALGQRSIFADPRCPDAKDRLNAEVKGREAFRPFAPMVQAEEAGDWFELGSADSPFMLRACRWHPHAAALVPSVVHVDGTGRVQTIARTQHPMLWRLLEEFRARSGVGILLNTSFNLAGHPIVETPSDAVWCLLASGLHTAVIGDHVVDKRSDFSLSKLWLVPAFSEPTQCEIVSDQPGGREVEPGDLGLATPAAIGERPELLLARLPSARPWSVLRFSMAVTSTPWGPLTHVLGPDEGRLLADMGERGCSAVELASGSAGLRNSAEPPARWLWRLLSVGLLKAAPLPQ